MNFQQLEYIVAVDTHRHFGEAAYSCNITQATLSAMIIKLEEELNVKIFDRSTKPVVTTEEGTRVISLAKQVLSLERELKEINREAPTELSGELKLGVIPTVASSLLPIILPVLTTQNPNLQLTVFEITTEEIKRRLKMGQIDLGILATPLENDSFEEDILYYEPMLVYGMEKGQRKYLVSKDILDQKVWLLEEGHCFRDQMITVCGIREKEEMDKNLNFQGSSFETLIGLSEQLGGITLVPELYYQSMSEERKKKIKSFEKPIPVREISIISYRPYAKKLTTKFLQDKIKTIVKPLLSSGNLKSSEMRVIGIN